MDRQEAFTNVYKNRLWNGRVSASGPGSDMEETDNIRKALPFLISWLGIDSMLDAPCGDFNWMQTLNPPFYIGMDIVPELIAENEKRYGSPTHLFRVGDICLDVLGAVDLIFCRDCFNHLTIADCLKAVANFKASGSKWLAATTYPTAVNNDTATWTLDGQAHEFTPGDCRNVNLEADPFDLGPPFMDFEESLTKHLGVWRLNA